MLCESILLSGAVPAAFGVTGAEFSPWLPVLPGHLMAHGLWENKVRKMAF